MAIKSFRRLFSAGLALSLISICSDVDGIDLPVGGINLNGYRYWNPAPPFLNVAGMGNQWISHAPHNGAWDDQRLIPLTADGYPASLLPDQYARTLIFTHNHANYPTGDYRVRWEGTGTLQLVGATLVDAKVGEATYRVTAPNANGLLLSITSTTPADPLRNLTVQLPTEINAPVTLNPAYATDLRNYGVIRYMDWNATNSHPITNWSQRTLPSSFHWGTERGVPYEAQITASNELQQDMWLTVPHAATDDYVRELASLVRNQLAPNLRVWVEYSNEVWNGQFAQFHYANTTLRQQYGPEHSPMYAYGRRAAEVFAIFEEFFPESESLVRVIAGQAANAWQLDQALQGVSATGESRADVAAIAPYFGLSTQELHTHFSDYLAATVDIDRMFSQLSADIQEGAEHWRDNNSIAQKFGVPLVAYEAGQHIVPSVGQQQSDPGFVKLLADINHDPRMGTLYDQLISTWLDIGGKTMAYYSDVGNWSQSGYWGLKETLSDNSAPKFQTVQRRLLGSVGDFNWDGMHDVSDVDLLIGRIVDGPRTSLFDLNHDGQVDVDDLDSWLNTAGKLTLPDGGPFVRGDANLDGQVDDADLAIWESFRFQTSTDWSQGDFNADGYVDVADFNLWHQHRLESANATHLAPEPASFWGVIIAAAMICRRW